MKLTATNSVFWPMYLDDPGCSVVSSSTDKGPQDDVVMNGPRFFRPPTLDIEELDLHIRPSISGEEEEFNMQVMQVAHSPPTAPQQGNSAIANHITQSCRDIREADMKLKAVARSMYMDDPDCDVVSSSTTEHPDEDALMDESLLYPVRTLDIEELDLHICPAISGQEEDYDMQAAHRQATAPEQCRSTNTNHKTEVGSKLLFAKDLSAAELKLKADMQLKAEICLKAEMNVEATDCAASSNIKAPKRTKQKSKRNTRRGRR